MTVTDIVVIALLFTLIVSAMWILGMHAEKSFNDLLSSLSK